MEYVIYALIVIIMAVVLQPKIPKVKPPSLDQLKLPTAKQGIPLPKVFGQRIVTSPNIVWYGDLAYNDVREKVKRLVGGHKYTTVGNRYFMGLHMAICHGPVDSVVDVFVGKKTLFPFGFSQTTAGVPNPTPAVNENGSYHIFLQDLFGGDRKEGGIVGTLDYEFGAITQPVNAYLSSQFGDETPAFRGATCLVFRETELLDFFGNVYTSSGGGGYVAAQSPYPKAWAMEILDIPGGAFNTNMQIVDGTSNGGHIIYDCLSNTDWGMGILPADIDSASFTAVTDQLFDEDFGLSIVYSKQSSMQDFINQILNHINGILYTDRSSGNFVLKLVRSQCVATDIPIFDELNVISLVSFERPSYAEIVNEVTVVYRKRGEFEDTSVTVQDLASVQLQGAVISQTTEYPGIDNKTLAGRVALRDLNSLGTPLARFKLTLNREAWNLNPGDTFVFSWAAYGIVQVVLRVLAANYGTFESGVVTVDAIEDIFNMPDNSYVDPTDTGWVEEVGNPVASPNSKAVELPYFSIQTTFEQVDIDAFESDTALLQVVAEAPPVATLSMQLWSRLSAGTYEQVAEGSLTPTLTLVGALDEQTKLTIPYSGLNGSLSNIVIGGYAYLDDEALRVDAIDTGALTIDLGRGFLDSIPVPHSAGAILYFTDSNDILDPEKYSVTDVLNAKVLTQTSNGTLDIDDATELTVTMAGRRTKPYPPAQVKIEAAYYPTAVEDTTVDVTWTHQDRTQQLAELDGSDWFETSFGSPETGVLYDVRYYNHDTSSLINTDAGVSGTSSSFAPPLSEGAVFNMRIEIDAIRDATETNFVTFSHVFTYTNPAAVTGTGALVAGDSVVAGDDLAPDNRTLENGDNRTLENGDNRITE